LLVPTASTWPHAAPVRNQPERGDASDPCCPVDRRRCDGIEDWANSLRVAVLRRPGFDTPVDAEGIAGVERAATILAEAGAEVTEADPALPDTSLVFSRVWHAALSRLVASVPGERRPLLDPGVHELWRGAWAK
jgi:aspartyl-tRNA(Asn)/glutamyl-tRNA(Gln) amidotransferase subunit A